MSASAMIGRLNLCICGGAVDIRLQKDHFDSGAVSLIRSAVLLRRGRLVMLAVFAQCLLVHEVEYTDTPVSPRHQSLIVL